MTRILRLPAEPGRLTLPTLLHRNAEDHADLPALSWHSAALAAAAAGPGAGAAADPHADAASTAWTTLTWGEARRRVLNLAAALAALGIGRGDKVLLMMPNSPEHWLTDLALVHLGAVPISVYNTAAADQIRHISRHSGAETAILDGPAEAERWQPALADTESRLSRLLLARPGTTSHPRLPDPERTDRDLAAVESAWRTADPAELLTVVYTSGTTGEPKGVAVSHHAVVANALALDGATDLPDHVEHVCYLPFAHIAERMLGIYLPVFRAAHVYLCPDAAMLGPVVRDVHPVQFFGVPRIWEKTAAAVQAAVERLPSELRTAIADAQDTVRHHHHALDQGTRPSAAASADCQAALDRTLRPILASAGLDRVERAASASAPMPPTVLDFWAGFGIRIMDAWGLTETMGVATTNTPDAFRAGSVGKATDGVELKLAADGEILVRSDFLTPGYLRADGTVEPVVDADGWFATGDVGRLDDDGFLWLTDRKKELIITSQGKNISPALVENALKAHPLIGQALAYGEGHPYIVALLVLDPEAATAWATARGLTGTIPELAGHPDLATEVAAAVAAANATLSRAEQVKKYHLLAREWSPETGELTPSLKLKRRIVVTRHGHHLEALYKNAATPQTTTKGSPALP
ncbi:AMP-dependent synthetase/ligase [Yinghuangia soli]|uniref:Acyl-CoA synthetase n=1 Tax=Yinghuangia soli TaxID=2908204 RepID=A0AA41PV40_9ACTN|nr:AMP-dependent synthetase/ligase [Yinghuangia soli]MCF2525890.1 AMP-binding protein [Yinghuangia soli]